MTQMADVQSSAPISAWDNPVLSADNVPDRKILGEVLRDAAPLLGLGAPVAATLDALLSFLPPKRRHHTVFASNATLSARRHGVTDRTLRRHITALIDAGLLIRRDSPNRKRYMRIDTSAQVALRFGLDLSPLFQRFPELCVCFGVQF